MFTIFLLSILQKIKNKYNKINKINQKSMKYIAIPTSNDYRVWYNNPCYVDKTWELLKIEWALARGSALFFARPRRWGKSLFFSIINFLNYIFF